jgi:hypothetical protein
MEASKIEIGTPGIKRALNKFDPMRAIAEFVWNGFDAGASEVEIQTDANSVGFISEMRIIDNGSGIPLSELHSKFRPFLHTNKVIDPSAVDHGPSAVHGKNGVGRLTFFKFAELAEWVTTYPLSDSEFRQYSVHIDSDSLNTFTSGPETVVPGPAGTVVRFHNLQVLSAHNIPSIRDYLACEFAWFLELQAPYSRRILINGKPLKYTKLVGDRDDTELHLGGHRFSVKYVRWLDRLHDEYSRYYFIDTAHREKGKKHTTLNNKGDGFYHSVYVQSPYFDTVPDLSSLPDGDGVDTQLPLAEFAQDGVFKDLLGQLDDYLRHKRRPFLRKRAARFVDELQETGNFPEFSLDTWDQHRKRELIEVVRDVYEADPRLFNNLSNQQKYTLVQLFSLAMSSSERESLLDVLSEVVNLDSKDRAELAKILRTTRLSNIIATIKLISDRFTAVDELKKLVFRPDFGANERDHLQSHIERHYWLFGEQYHLVTAAEPDFEQALRRFVYVLRGEDQPLRVDHPDKNKEMDVFAVRRLPHIDEIQSIVVELKHPSVVLGGKELQQVKQYMTVILEQPQFNGDNMSWEFYLVGNEYDGFITGELESTAANGQKHLVHRRAKHKIYVLKWSEILTSFELRHNFILDKLKLERDALATGSQTADEILANGHRNSAAQAAV